MDASERLRTASWRYWAMSTIFYVVTGIAVTVIISEPTRSLPSAQLGVCIVLFAALGFYISGYKKELRNCERMVALGCEPIRTWPNDPFGIRYLLDTAKHVKANTLLQQRVQLFKDMGHTFSHRLFPETDITITTDEPENVKAILSTKFDDWAIPPGRIQGFLPVLGRHSIFNVNGPEWQHSRAMLRPAFIRNQISDLECIDRHISKLIAHIPKDGSRFDLQAMFAMLAIDTISDFMFGQSTDILGSAPDTSLKFGTYFDRSIEKIAYRSRLGWMTQLLPDAELKEYTHFMTSYIAKYIAEVKSKGSKSALADDKNKYVFLEELIKSGEPDNVIRDQILSIFVAGRDTTTSVLTYLFFELSRHPEAVGKIQEEIQDLGVADPSWEQLRNMKYLNLAVKEALRLNPPVATNAREAVRDTVLPTGGGPDGKSPVFAPKGTKCRYQPWTMQRREDIYGSDAAEFRPERWEDLRVTHEYVPFNAGPRICIGQQFALTQLALVTFRLLQSFRTIERKDDRPPLQKLGVNTSMLHGCWVIMIPV
ncbi:cytochrome P450 [Pseudomassariella vexata]|uniref:Cytochrome P450 n=1 Tax=Pseudomassariella vexata TaxID=1141098 RepID=A0A1Y2DIR3_9PEZI|nr:cytochrome P450 [Pseudomassariella vexata]ORY59117.1 cytochrome P450 [Pseudomassariella vexata]